MQTSDDNLSSREDQTPLVSPGTYSPVTVYFRDMMGVIFLGVLNIILLIGWMRSEARYRSSMTKTDHGLAEPQSL